MFKVGTIVLFEKICGEHNRSVEVYDKVAVFITLTLRIINLD